VTNSLRTDLAAYATRASLDPDLAVAGLDREYGLVAEAILLVANGGSSRVTVAGLRFANQVVEACRPLAAARRVWLQRLPTALGYGPDVAVERLDRVSRLAEVR
jgi:hypothetical protein